MKPVRCIVAGVGELAGGDPTLSLAMDLARQAGARLHLVHAFQYPPLFTMAPGLEMVDPQGSAQYEAVVRQRLQAIVRQHDGEAEVECYAIPGSPGQVLADAAERLGADLLVVGAARPGRLGRPLLGTTAQRVLRGAHVPVLVARTALHRAPRRVLLATDLSEMGGAAYEQALDVLDALYGLDGTELRALMVLAFGLVPSPLPEDALEQTAYVELDRFLRARRARPVQVRPAVRIGEPAAQIVDELSDWNADLLVVGTHGRRGLPRMWLGSVAEACIRDSPCSVLAIPPARVPAERAMPPAEEAPSVTAGAGEDGGVAVGTPG